LFQSFVSADGFFSLLEVMFINVVLSGDNAIVIGMAAAGLPKELRAKAILFGMIAAIVLRIAFALVATNLMGVPGVVLVGGLLLSWICWKMWSEMREGDHQSEGGETLTGLDLNHDGKIASNAARKTFAQAAWQIVLADVSMSLDNVLAVAGASREHPTILIMGLILSIAVMGLAATFFARLLETYRWIGYVGLAIIVYVAGKMIYEGSQEAWPHLIAML
jgi:YjbE family integral membrane protein